MHRPMSTQLTLLVTAIATAAATALALHLSLETLAGNGVAVPAHYLKPN